MRYYISLLSLFILASCSPSIRTEKLAFASDRNTVAPRNVKLISTLVGNRLAYATADSLIVMNGAKRDCAFDLPSVLALLPIGDTLAIGAKSGYYTLDLRTSKLKHWSIPSRQEYPQVNALAIDYERHVWIATHGYGLYQVLGDKMRPIPTAPYMSCVAVTSDSGVWAGSNIGLFRIFASGEIKRYYEETSNGISIPDNIIEHMQSDARGNLWVFASKAVTILRPEDYRAVAPTGIDKEIEPINYAYLGKEGNSITKFFQRKGHHNIWWALSAEGLLALSNIDIESEQPEGMPDIPQTPKGHLEIVSSFKDASTKSIVKFPKPNDITFDAAGNLWLACDEGIWQISAETLDGFERKFLASK